MYKDTEKQNICETTCREMSIEELLRSKAKSHREYSTRLDLLADTMANARMDEVSYKTLRTELMNSQLRIS